MTKLAEAIANTVEAVISIYLIIRSVYNGRFI